ncbi:hypothetical protein NL676_014308 [Syzygium grande]|nr:hypothetical protein NL676_014308 [Syzygium grande]
MSGAPKRSHEESGHSSSKYTHEDLTPYPRLMPAVSSEYHLSHDTGQESRMAKIPRTESRDSDRRSPMQSVFRMPSSSLDDPHLDHAASSESRLEARDAKDGRDFRVDNRDPKPETRESYETKRDSQHMRSEREGKVEIRGDDSKKLKYERDSYSDPKVDGKVEKESYGAGSSHLNWKESKEYHRGKRYSETPSGSMDPWHIQRNNPPGQFESAKEDSTTEERGHIETHEAVGENKIDTKIDDKLKDKDRKRKDVKHREWGERDKDRIDRRSSMPVNNSAADFKDPARDEREAEKLEKDRKDPGKGQGKIEGKGKGPSKERNLEWAGERGSVLGEGHFRSACENNRAGNFGI